MTAPQNFSLLNLSSVPIAGEDRTFPIHCIVEQEDDNLADSSSTARCVCDMYVVLPGSTLFRDLTRSALAQLSFPTSDMLAASGTIQFRNWKPLLFSSITDDPNSTIEQIFSDVFSSATIRIRLCRKQIPPAGGGMAVGGAHQMAECQRRVGNWTDEKVRSAIVKLLRDHTQSELAAVSPLSQPTISNIANSRYRASISEETCRAFGEWYDAFKLQKQDSNGFRGSSSKQRLTYHPIYELPLMREWFQLCPNPTREELVRFTDQLNSTPIRKERVLVSPSRLRIWWINEKQRMRRVSDPGFVSRSGRKRLQPKWVEPAEQNGHSSTETNEMIDVGHTEASKSFTLLH